MNLKTSFSLSIIIFLLVSFKSEISLSKKSMKVDGKYVECKSPKNSFERTRGVRTRICIFKKDDCAMGLYGIRCKYLNEFQFNLPHRSPECNLAIFIRENINDDKICEVNTLNLECQFADNHRIVNI